MSYSNSMSSYIESEGPPSNLSSFGSMKEESLSVEDMERLIRKLRKENKALQLRVLGVNELARLLQDRNEVAQVLKEKNKRLEVAVVRLENRCANLEQKMRSEGGPASLPKSGQAPMIPGPSRQILEGLVKENSELKKALNSMQRKGATGYLEAVKTSQLEEVIVQQKQEMQFLRGQINTLTSPPPPPTTTTSSGDDDKSQSEGGSDSAFSSIHQSTSQPAGGPGSPGNLRRQLIKMQHSLKVKDRFCTLLSEQVASLQEKLNSMHLDATPEPEEPSNGSQPEHTPKQTTDQDTEYVHTPRPAEGHPQIEDLKSQLIQQKEEMEGKYKHLMDEQKETLQKERKEHMALVDKLQETEQELKKTKREIANLEQRCDDLNFHVHTLLGDKKRLNDELSEARGEGGKGSDSSKQLEKELLELQNTLSKKDQEHSEEMRNLDKENQQLQMMLEGTQYKYAIAESRISNIVDEHKQQMSELQKELDEKHSEVAVKQNEVEDIKTKYQQLQVEMSRLRARGPGPPVHIQRPQYTGNPHADRPNLMLPTHMHNMETVRDGNEPSNRDHSQVDPTVRRPTNTQLGCGTNQLDTMTRFQLVARDPTEEPPPSAPPSSSSGQPHHPSSLPFRSVSSQPRHLSPSPSPAATPHNTPGRRSPAPTGYAAPQPRSGHPTYTHTSGTQTPSASYHSSPMGGYTQRPPQRPPRYSVPDHTSGYNIYPMGGPGTRGNPPQMGPGGAPVPRDSGGMGPGESGSLPPGGHPGDPSTSPHHHYHHPPRRN